MADFYLDKGHFITARREGPAFFDEDDAFRRTYNIETAYPNYYDTQKRSTPFGVPLRELHM